MGTYSKKLQEVKELLQKLKNEVPEEIKGFNNFFASVETEGALNLKQKHLINVALAVAAQCEWCISLHVKEALNSGATKKEIIEAGMQAVLMHGGPALMYMIPLEKAIEEFSNED